MREPSATCWTIAVTSHNVHANPGWESVISGTGVSIYLFFGKFSTWKAVVFGIFWGWMHSGSDSDPAVYPGSPLCRRVMNFMTMMSSEVLVGRTDLAYGTRVPRMSWIFEGNPNLYQRIVIHSARMAKPILHYQYHATYHIFCVKLALWMLIHVDTLYVHTHTQNYKYMFVHTCANQLWYIKTVKKSHTDIHN